MKWCIGLAFEILLVGYWVDRFYPQYKAYRRHKCRRTATGTVVTAWASPRRRDNTIAKVKFAFGIKLDDNLLEAIDASTPLPKAINKKIFEYMNKRFFVICREARMDGTDDAAAVAKYPRGSKLTVVYEGRDPRNSNIASEESSERYCLAFVIWYVFAVGIMVVSNCAVLLHKGEIIRALIYLTAMVICCYVCTKRARRIFNKNSVEIKELREERGTPITVTV